jgi:hypothetical protein
MCQGKMQNIGLDRLRTWLTADDSRLALGTAVGVAVLVGLVTGAMFGTLGPALALGAVGGLAVGLLMLRSIRWGLFALIGLICLLPYGAIPIDVGFRPTFIDVVLLALFGVWFVRKTGRSEGWKGGELEGWKTGRVEDWKDRKLDSVQSSDLPIFRSSDLPSFHPSSHLSLRPGCWPMLTPCLPVICATRWLCSTPIPQLPTQ